MSFDSDILPTGVWTYEIIGAVIRPTRYAHKSVGEEAVFVLRSESGSGNIVVPLSNDLYDLNERDTCNIHSWQEVLDVEYLTKESVAGVIGGAVKVRVRHWLDRSNRKRQQVDPLELVSGKELQSFIDVFGATRVGKVPD